MNKMIDDFELPQFMDGTFDWRENGLQFASIPSLDLLAPNALTQPNPWIVLAAILQRAKAGDHSKVPVLEKYVQQQVPFALSRVSLLLVGDLGTDQDLRILEGGLQSEDAEIRMSAARASSLAGALWLVPAMVQAWNRASGLDEHESIGFAVSNLLEDGDCPIAQEASKFPLRLSPPPPTASAALKQLYEQRPREVAEPLFPQLVRETYQRLTNEFGSDRVAVWQGKKFDVVAFARDFLSKLPSIGAGTCTFYRHKFEAATGVDCRHFFRDIAPHYLAIADTLEDFLAASEKLQFEPGLRYFFGHRIPT